MKLADFDLGKVLAFHPEAGKLLLGDERMLIFRQDAFAFLRRLLFDQLGEQMACSLLMQFGYRCGMGDFQALSRSFPLDDEQERLAIGPVMHSWEGIVLVEPEFLKFDRARGSFHARGLWKNSYEAEIHRREFGSATEHPVCFSLCGYGSGWCSAFFGRPVLEIEITCVGRGDPVCTWEIRPIDEWGSEADLWRNALSATRVSVARELEDKLRTIEEQRGALARLATPIIQVWDRVLVLPIIGTVDLVRSGQLSDALLAEIVRTKARFAILDLTGVDAVDTPTAEYLLRILQAVRLLGATGIVCGVRPTVAQHITSLGLPMQGVKIYALLADALRAIISTAPG